MKEVYKVGEIYTVPFNLFQKHPYLLFQSLRSKNNVLCTFKYPVPKQKKLKLPCKTRPSFVDIQQYRQFIEELKRIFYEDVGAFRNISIISTRPELKTKRLFSSLKISPPLHNRKKLFDFLGITEYTLTHVSYIIFATLPLEYEVVLSHNVPLSRMIEEGIEMKERDRFLVPIMLDCREDIIVTKVNAVISRTKGMMYITAMVPGACKMSDQELANEVYSQVFEKLVKVGVLRKVL